MNICVLCLLAGPSIRLSVCPSISQSVSQSVSAHLSVSVIYSVSQPVCLPTHQSVSVSQLQITHLTCDFFSLCMYTYLFLLQINTFTLTSFSFLQCTSSLNNVMCGYVATQTLLQVQNLSLFLLSQYFVFCWLCC